ncbi:helix-turn-helix transcriptional regulator [Actinosynnema sp. NPDC023587]|uniref:helix-turn-helix domain-containing protein n=1 Tax=Actinosynnema sp. NPDC023587 TaxID=3154695 RepID=UPI0033D419DB
MAREAADVLESRRALGEKLATFRSAARMTQAQLGQATFSDRTRIAHLEKGRARADRHFWQAADEALGASGVLLASFVEFVETKHRMEREVREAELAAMRERVDGWRLSGAAVEGDRGVSAVAELLGPAQTLDLLDTYTRSVIARYELEGPQRLAPEVLALRRLGHQLTGRVSGAERTRLTLASARHAALLAYMSVNLSRFDDAERFALEASMLATALGDAPLLAWIKGTQSFAAYYQERYQEALNVAQVGVGLAGSDLQRIRLLSNGVARAAGKLGDRRTAERAAGEALELAEHAEVPSGMTSCIDFLPYGRARAVANAATAQLSLGNHKEVLRLTGDLRAAVADSGSDWSRSLVSLDEATALAVGREADLEHAAAVGQAALAASSAKPIASVASRAGELAVSLKLHGSSRASDEFTAALHAWRRDTREMLT